jgi:hypothetical protein
MIPADVDRERGCFMTTLLVVCTFKNNSHEDHSPCQSHYACHIARTRKIGAAMRQSVAYLRQAVACSTSRCEGTVKQTRDNKNPFIHRVPSIETTIAGT